ncbi:RHS repeat-associated core domain-containing protein [Desulfonema ishimotonii]|uniref:RHS repeat-associated core domain-containing protein n=1 Tax=Desulfonema ishimotonii TaxID=45657 RepID=UPI001AA06D4D|nr:RHS repeat-associated core domain-containing protein [Desulfonema ishimotonii]
MTAQITEKYLWSGLTTLLAVYDGSDNLLMRFEYAAGRTPVAMTKGGQRYYLAYDQVGTLRAVTDASGNTVKRVGYDTFGNVLTDSDPLFEVPFGFAGGLYDEDTGLIRFGYRDYDPNAGRWTAKDPIGFAGGDTDLYGYCLGDPVNWVDPKGLTISIPLPIPNILPFPPSPALAGAIAFGAGWAIGTWINDNYISPWLWEKESAPCLKSKRRKNRIPDRGTPGTVKKNGPDTTRKKYGDDGWVEKEWNEGHGPDAPAGEQNDHIHDHIPNPFHPEGRPNRQPGREPRPGELTDFGF